MDKSLIGIGVALGVSFFILYRRRKKWLTEKKVWFTCILLFTIGLLGFLYSKSGYREDKIMYFGFCGPLFYWIFDRIFKRISESIHKRDFILFLMYSDEIDDSVGAKNPHVKDSDKLFSFGLLVVIIVIPIIGFIII